MRMSSELEKALGTPFYSVGRLQVAAVLAQRGMPDSARVLVDQVRTSGSAGPWTRYFEANVQLHLGRADLALDLLEEFLSDLPQRRAYISRDWWWEPLREESRFQEMVADRSG